jgi:hypothetical protein
MTPNETALSLVEKYMPYVEEIGNAGWEFWYDTDMKKRNAKACAIIAVEQAILYHPFPNEPDERDIKFHQYWQEVKNEINQL